MRAADPQQALLALTVVDPACGSGHFVVAAARRIATALATVRTGDTEPAPPPYAPATADVIERCVYGVDLNDLAIEITKVALWLEAFDADRPFPFLDAHFRVGNALLGTTPALLRDNIPDTAFVVARRRRQRLDRQAQGPQQGRTRSRHRSAHARLRARDTQRRNHPVHQGRPRRRRRHRRHPRAACGHAPTRGGALEADPDLVAAKLVADAWCAAFVQPKKAPARGPRLPGRASPMRRCATCPRTPDAVPDTVIAQIDDLARQYRFFHWHLEFPGIFTVPDDGSADPGTGWKGGFSCVVGNPPWERAEDPGQGVLRQRRPRRHRRRRRPPRSARR